MLLFHQPSDVTTMHIDGGCAGRRGLADVGERVAMLRRGLRDPAELTALAPVLAEDAHDKGVRPRNHGRDSVRFTIAPVRLDPIDGEILDHLAAALGALVRKTADRIAADDEA